ncbi:MAG TPA: hydrogenase maturation nickel metallochaperone HypA [Desulfotomaculum sp.]|nr:MAG: hypothetical protein JL56_07690 [Desulfotomaculum sp. BICA1-6]HBX23262.1 hydrogenase maturation nickel metallochaperone HypA [Desulfotomaculum sp.]
MHEVSLIQALLDMVNKSAAENGVTKVNLVKLVVGEMHGAVPDALEFAFEVLTEGTVCAGAKLEVEKKLFLFRCDECGREFNPTGLSRRCPGCRTNVTTLVAGRELYVDYYEGD